MHLNEIQSPETLRAMTASEVSDLAGEIREELIQTVARNGGHLASNLGAVELTLALHRVFHAPEDKLIFDVGHQSYVHKMITGRFDRFHTLREYGGISGFPKRGESEYDCFETGHASTAISAALGFARARDFRGEGYDVVAVVGDGALTGGMCYEALNDAGHGHTRMIVVLNDNEMSIAPNVGALSAYLTRLRISGGWRSAKKRVRHLNNTPLKPIYRLIHSGKSMMKSVIMKDSDVGFFEALGFQYFGPIDGHDIVSLENTFRQARDAQGPCVIHVLTLKGHGYEQAERKPEAFHGTPPFYIETGSRIKLPDSPSCGHIAGNTLAELSRNDTRIVAVTAAMPLGTGMDHYAEIFPSRLIDVGIAEEHAATMCAGMAAGGMKPYFAVYGSFFQRCYDQMIHDVAMQRLPVTFLLDRCGIGGEDGQTHHGLFDLAAALPVPGMNVLAPADAEELVEMIRWSAGSEEPCVIRYPKYLPRREKGEGNGNGEDAEPKEETGAAEGKDSGENRIFRFGKWQVVREGTDGVILAVGSMVAAAVEIADLLAGKEDALKASPAGRRDSKGRSAEKMTSRRISLRVVNCSTVKPLDEAFLESVPADLPVFTLEEHMLIGGFGAFVRSFWEGKAVRPKVTCFGVRDVFIQHGDHDHLLADAGLKPEQVALAIRESLQAGASCSACDP